MLNTVLNKCLVCFLLLAVIVISPCSFAMPLAEPNSTHGSNSTSYSNLKKVSKNSSCTLSDVQLVYLSMTSEHRGTIYEQDFLH
jgi:hypothetical protein